MERRTTVVSEQDRLGLRSVVCDGMGFWSWQCGVTVEGVRWGLPDAVVRSATSGQCVGERSLLCVTERFSDRENELTSEWVSRRGQARGFLNQTE